MSWDKIPEDAKFDCREPKSVVTLSSDKASDKLKGDSIDYLDKNRNLMRENDTNSFFDFINLKEYDIIFYY